MAKILALDISSSCTGYCIFNNGKLNKSSVSSITFNKKWGLGQKLKFFESEITNIINKYKPDVLAIEDIFRGPNVKTFKTLACFRGIAIKVGYDTFGQDPVSIMPSEARKLVGCGIKKEDGFAFAIKKFGLKNYVFEKDNDKADAIIIGLACSILQKDNNKDE